jgi:ATP-binding cassette subfamily B protein
MSSTVKTGAREPFRRVFAFVFGLWGRQRARVTWIAALALVATLADVLMPLFAGRLVDAVSSAGGDRDAALASALQALGAMAMLGLAGVGFRFAFFNGIVKLTLAMMAAIAGETFARVQRFSTDWHANSFAGSTVRKITRGMWALDQLNDIMVIAVLPSLVVLAGSTALLAWHWPVMGLLVGAGSLAFVTMTVLLSTRWVAPAARLSNVWDTRIGAALADAISCNAVVKAFGAEAREDTRFGGVVDKWRRRTRRTWTRGNVNGGLQGLCLALLQTGVLAVAVWLWWRGRASAGDVAYVLTAYAVVQGYLRDVGLHVRMLQRSVNDMEELVAFHAEPMGVADRPDADPIKVGAGEVRFDEVVFHYGGHATPLYDGLSVTIGAGERVGLVGHSGSGKTTFVKLVQRLYDVTGGRILIDGQDIAAATQQSLRSQIALVPQEPILFHRTLAENIAYARPSASQADIEKAARLANAHGFIERLPRGYATLVGERGVKLSGGERQRVALARAFLADAPILILDEATSSLDSESEAAVQEAMERLMKGRTSIIIAHRLSTVRAVDRILVFDRGRIVEEGSHGVLIHRENGLYRRLFERQALGIAA